MTPRTIHILCVDDHAFLVDGLKAKFALEPGLVCVGRLPSAERLINEVERLRPQIVLLDIEMPGPDPFEAAADIRTRFPETRVVVLSAYVRDHYISAAFKAGVSGYFCKSDDTSEIIQGIRRVARGEFVFGPKVAERCRPAHGSRAGMAPPSMLQARPSTVTRVASAPKSKLDILSNREQEVLRLIGRGLTRLEIAKSMSRSPKTVDGHRERIMSKLDLHTTAELVRFAIREGVAEV
ncbi:MAG: response regulator transcription factor [Phycisphaerales bacterium]|nr:response regulator transcription factor [Phycisphaerales bacterium]